MPGSTYRALFTAAFVAVGQTPRVVHQSAEWDSMTAFVSAGLGVGFLPRLAPLSGVKNVVRLRLAGPNRPVRRILAVGRRGSLESPLIRESLAMLQQSARGILAERRD
jgi:DNA-binding transcriptional LysR family regulator